MAPFNKKFAPKLHPSRLRTIIGIVVAIIIIAIIVLALRNPITNVSSSSTFSLSTNQSTYFMLPGNPNVYSIFLFSASNSSATVYVTGTPVLTKTVSSVTLASAQVANVSTDGSQVANVQVRLISTKFGSAQVSITLLPSSLQIRPSGYVVLLYPSLPNTQGSVQITTAPATTTVPASTTIASGASTTKSTTVPTTVTTASQFPTATIMEIVNSSPVGTLLHNYDALYVSDRACTASVYDSTFYTYEHFAAVPPEDFANVSAITPISFKLTISQVGTDTYNVTYVPQLPSGRVVPFTAIVTANVSSYAVTKYVFGQDLNYTNYNSQYQFQSGIANYCGAYIE